MRQLIASYLGENELRVTAVASGAEMAKALEQHVIDLVVLDLRLSGEDGMQIAQEAARRIRNPDHHRHRQAG